MLFPLPHLEHLGDERAVLIVEPREAALPGAEVLFCLEEFPLAQGALLFERGGFLLQLREAFSELPVLVAQPNDRFLLLV